MSGTSITALPAGREAERRLAAMASAGDDQAFAALFHTYRADAYRVARAVTGDHQAALDAVQETFIKVHRALDRWKGTASLRTWIVRIAVRVAIDLRRVSDRSERTVRAWKEPVHDPRSELDQGLLLERLQRLAAGVRGRQGVVLRLRLLGGLTNREIAEALHLREANVRMQLTKAVRRLRTML